MDVNWLVSLLVALYPRRWRGEYGDEFRALLEAEPLELVAVVDVVLHAARARASAHARVLRLLLAVGSSVVVEIVAVRLGVTENILWPPTSAARIGFLLLLVLPWLGPLGDLRTAIVARRRAAL